MSESVWPFEETEPTITFNTEDTNFLLDNQDALRNWILRIIQLEKQELGFVSFIFCSDAYLYQLNLEYLNHDTFTDVITFPYGAAPLIEGDIFISIDRIRENAQSLDLPFHEELHRVMIHGVLHLCGYEDKNPEAKTQMTKKENEALSLLVFQS